MLLQLRESRFIALRRWSLEYRIKEQLESSSGLGAEGDLASHCYDCALAHVE